MKVDQLIKELNKLPKNLEVYWADHDHGTYETNNRCGQVHLVNKNEMTEFDNDKDCGLSDCFQHTPKKYVCLRP